METRYYSFKEIVESLPKKKNSRSSLWVKLVVRKLSFFFTYLFVNLHITPWLASVISAVVALAGSVFFCFDACWCRIVGLVLTQMWLVLDCVDGNIARVTKTCSYMGDFIDTLSGYVISACSMLGIGIAASYTSNLTLLQDSNVFIILGAIGSIGNVLARLIHQNYMVTLMKLEKKGKIINNPDNDVEADKGIGYIRSRIDKEIGISGLYMPLLILMVLINRLDLLTIFYSLFFGASALAIAGYYAIKSKQ